MSEQQPGPDVHVVLVSDEPTLEGLIRELFATSIPAVVVERTGLSAAVASPSVAVIVDQSIRGAPGLDAAQEIRGRAYRGGIILLTSGADADIDRKLLAIAPAKSVIRGKLVEQLPAALGALSAVADPGGELGTVQRELRRMQQLVAAGESTMRIQHALNNPLAALMAEAQLLELEPLTEENLAAVKRIVQLCRRMVVMVRGMDTVPAPKPQ
jgi:signal transduction histidine kinase